MLLCPIQLFKWNSITLNSIEFWCFVRCFSEQSIEKGDSQPATAQLESLSDVQISVHGISTNLLVTSSYYNTTKPCKIHEKKKLNQQYSGSSAVLRKSNFVKLWYIYVNLQSSSMSMASGAQFVPIWWYAIGFWQIFAEYECRQNEGANLAARIGPYAHSAAGGVPRGLQSVQFHSRFQADLETLHLFTFAAFT